MALPLSTSLGDAQTWLRQRVDKGERCPCCTQFSKVYRRKITSGQAYALIKMYRSAGMDWFYMPELQKQWASRDESTLRYFGLLEEASTPRPDGGRAGWWRITNLGEQWLLGNIKLPKYARIYDGRCLALDPTDQAGIKDALGSKFSYSDLMQGI